MSHDTLLGKIVSVPADLHPHEHYAHGPIVAVLEFPFVVIRELPFDQNDAEPPIGFVLDITKPDIMLFDSEAEFFAWHQWIRDLPEEKTRRRPEPKLN